MNVAYIGLGSNLNQPETQIAIAIGSISTLPEIQLIARAPLYKSSPVGPQDQPDFINTAIKIRTTFSPDALLSALQHIERSQGRVKTRHWGERSIDLDILLYSNLLYDNQLYDNQLHNNQPNQNSSSRLIIPHPELQNRDFVLKPLLDICPTLSLPSGAPLSRLLSQCPDNNLQKMPAATE